MVSLEIWLGTLIHLILGFRIESDYSRIRQVLVNLCANAVKFTPTRAAVSTANSSRLDSVSVRCALDDTRPPPDKNTILLRFSVQDTGIGMTQAGCDSLFRPFQQLDNGTTRRFGGTGLGLSISRQLVTLMGGMIGVESELGQGSTFWFTIPVQPFVSPEAQQAVTETRILRTRLVQPNAPRVLIISSSPTTRALLTHLLVGFIVMSVDGLDAGLKVLRGAHTLSPPLEFVLLDDQSDTHAEGLASVLRTAGHTAALVHLYTPTTGLGAGHVRAGSAQGVTRMTKPPREARLLHTLARLKNIDTAPTTTISGGTFTSVPAAPRTLFGNVLIAEDNLVAQRLLVKQLEKYGIRAVATSNGQEAVDRKCVLIPHHEV
jgi:hypothetical protein